MTDEEFDEEIKLYKEYITRKDLSIEERAQRGIEILELSRKCSEERQRSRPPLVLPKLSFKSLDNDEALAHITHSGTRERVMTYEQMEKTMQFILDQQATTAARQGEFDEKLNRLAEASAQQNRQFDERFTQMTADFAERSRQFDERFRQMTADFAERSRQFDGRFRQMTTAAAEQNRQIHEILRNITDDLATLSADSMWHREANEEHESRMNQLTDKINALAEQMASLGSSVEVLAETVKNLIKGGSNGWQQQ
jgi:uncharacterized protein YukE